MRISCRLLAVFLLFGFRPTTSHARLVNVTMDDTVPDALTGNTFSYQPPDAWNTEGCSQCTARPEAPRVFSGTWHESTFNTQPGSNAYPNQTLFASTLFNGSAIYVFCVLARTTNSPFGNSDMTFLIDGELVGTFAKEAPGSAGYDYNVLVYSNTTVRPGNHQLTIRNGHVGGPRSLLILDSIIYSYDDGTPAASTSPATTPKDTPIGPIVGGVVGGLGVIAIAGLAFFFYRRRKHRRDSVHPVKVEAFSTHPTPWAPEGDHSTHGSPSTHPGAAFALSQSAVYGSSHNVQHSVVPSTSGYSRPQVPGSMTQLTYNPDTASMPDYMYNPYSDHTRTISSPSTSDMTSPQRTQYPPSSKSEQIALANAQREAHHRQLSGQTNAISEVTSSSGGSSSGSRPVASSTHLIAESEDAPPAYDFSRALDHQGVGSGSAGGSQAGSGGQALPVADRKLPIPPSQ